MVKYICFKIFIRFGIVLPSQVRKRNYNADFKWYFNNHVTANAFAIQSESGSRSTINSASEIVPKAAAHAAFIRIKARTPAFTAFPISAPWGFLIACFNGIKIITPKSTRNTELKTMVLLVKEMRRMATITSK